jgi:vancomycin permeability regulator SanA
VTYKKYGVVIVLANWMTSDGKLNNETQARVDQACKLFLEKKTELILLMGWDYRKDTTLCISDAMNNYVKDCYAIDSGNVLIDRISRDTVGDAVFSKRNFQYLMPSNTICIVTSDYHRGRAKTIFDFVYGKGWNIDVIGITTDHDVDVEKHEATSLDAFTRTFFGIDAGDDVEIFRTMLEKHPYYNGKVYTKIQHE